MDSFTELVDDFVDSIRDDVTLVEKIVLEWDSGDIEESSINKVMRIIHSLKGSSGSYGFRNVSRLCHMFEDRLIELKEKNEIKKGVDHFLSHIDEFKKFIETAADIELSEEIIESDDKTILIVDESPVFSKMISHELKSFGYKFQVVKDGINAIELVLAKKFDMIIISTSIRGIDGLSLLKSIKVIDSINQNTPTAILSSRENIRIEERFEPDLHLVKSKDLRSTLKEKIKTFLSKTSAEKKFDFKKAVYIDDSSSLHPLMKMAFRNVDCELICFERAAEGIDYINKNKPDLILCDYNLDQDVTGKQVLKAVKGNSATFFFFTGETEKAFAEVASRNKEIAGVIFKPFSPKRLTETITSTLNN